MLPRKHYPAIINTELRQIEFEVGNLQRTIDRSNDEVKNEYQVLVDILYLKLNQAKEKLGVLEQASKEEWDEVKADLDITRDALKSIWSATAQLITA